MISGRKFDCSHLKILHKFKLADKYKIEEEIPVRIFKIKKIFFNKGEKARR
jgi:hypothetical protein